MPVAGVSSVPTMAKVHLGTVVAMVMQRQSQLAQIKIPEQINLNEMSHSIREKL